MSLSSCSNEKAKKEKKEGIKYQKAAIDLNRSK